MRRALALYRLAQLEELYRSDPTLTYKDVARKLRMKYDAFQKMCRRSGLDRREQTRLTEDRRKNATNCPKVSTDLNK